MKQIMKKSNKIIFGGCILALFIFSFSACDDDEPKKEDTPELITKVTLTFTPSSGTPVVVTATDPDGEGVQDLVMDGPINLAANSNYTLSVGFINGLAEPSDPEYNITAEVMEESDEHMLFFGWANDVFTDPSGNGNIDSRSDDVNYNDFDANSQPLGLNTSWATAGVSSGTFRVLLKHQPELKSATSSSNEGESDADITFTINVQ
jgi:hypothetical protein